MRARAIWPLAFVAVLLAVGATRDAAGQKAVDTPTRPVEGGGSYADIGAADLAAMLTKKNFTLINVHVPYEGEIGGRMSAIAVRTLVALGYRDVWHLDRGMIDWQRAGYPLIRKGG